MSSKKVLQGQSRYIFYFNKIWNCNFDVIDRNDKIFFLKLLSFFFLLFSIHYSNYFSKILIYWIATHVSVRSVCHISHERRNFVGTWQMWPRSILSKSKRQTQDLLALICSFSHRTASFWPAKKKLSIIYKTRFLIKQLISAS